jgi:hypothetical protein
MAKRRSGFNVFHTPGFRLTDQGLGARGVDLDRNALFETEHHADIQAYARWVAAMSMIRGRTPPNKLD